MRTTRSATVAAAAGLVGLVVSAFVLWPGTGPGPSPADPRADVSPVTVPTPARSATAAGQAPVAAGEQVGRRDASLTSRPAETRVPVRIRMGTVDIDAAVRPVGVERDAQMELPGDPRVMGWYRYGPAPGDPVGSAVLAGHLDAVGFGLGPLARLRDVEVGDRVEVDQSDGTSQVFVVRRVQRFDRQGLPPELFARTGPGLLRVITCGGAYLPEAGGYQENLVVTAVPGRSSRAGMAETGPGAASRKP